MKQKGFTTFMKTERGFAHLLLLIILLAGLFAGVYLVTSGNPLKLFSKAFEPKAASAKQLSKLPGTGIEALFDPILNTYSPIEKRPKRNFVAGEVLVKFKDAKIADQVATSQQDQRGVLQVDQSKGVGKIIQQFGIQTADRPIKDKVTNGQRIVRLTSNKLKNNKEGTQQLVKVLQQQSEVEFTQPNYIFKTSFLPNDQYVDPDGDGVWSKGAWGQTYSDLWGLEKIKAADVWSTVSGQGVIVAVVDSGVDYNHEDITGNIWQNSGEINNNGIDDDNNGYIDDVKGWDFTTCDEFNFSTGECTRLKEEGNSPIDNHGHGTHVAGTIAAVGSNAKGIIGVAPGAKILVLKGLNSQGSGTTLGLVNAIYYAANNGAKIINASWGSDGGAGEEDNILTDAVNFAHDSKGVVFVAAAGNESLEVGNSLPAGLDNVISVAASDPDDKRIKFSNWGVRLDISAPGGGVASSYYMPPYTQNILSLRAASSDMYGGGGMIVSDKYYRSMGTSMAAPHVSGLAALILAKNPTFTNEQVRQIIRSTADDIESSGFDVYSGYGRINAQKALQLATASVAIITSPSNYQIVKGQVNISGTAAAGDFDHYTLEYAALNNSPSFNTISSSASAVTSGLLGSWNTANLENNYYIIKLTVFDKNGHQFEDRRMVVVYNTEAVQTGWPQSVADPTVYFTAPAYGDLDGDGSLELVVGYHRTAGGYLGNDTFGMMAWHADGTAVSGFPVNTSILASKPVVTLGDLDKDGKLEIVVNTDQGIYAWNNKGELLSGFPLAADENFEYSPVVLSDMNGDRDLEIIAGSKNTGKVYVWSSQGQLLAGWPNVTGSKVVFSLAAAENMVVVGSSDGWGYNLANSKVTAYNFEGAQLWSYALSSLPFVSIGDVDGDKNIDVIYQQDMTGYISCEGPDPCATGQLIGILNKQGNLVKSWPVPKRLHFGVALADINKDGKLEIAASSGEYYSGTIYLWNSSGDLVTGWPKTLSGNSYLPILADINGDGEIDVVSSFHRDFSSSTYTHSDFYSISAWNNDGSEISGWPVKIFLPRLVSAPSNLQATILDLNKDGKVDLALPADEGKVYLLSPGASYNQSKVEWGMYRYDSKRSGTYPIPSPTSTCSACNADIDKSGTVDNADYNRLKDCFGKFATGTDANGRSCTDADINKDSKINLTDFNCLKIQLNKSCQQ